MTFFKKALQLKLITKITSAPNRAKAPYSITIITMVDENWGDDSKPRWTKAPNAAESAHATAEALAWFDQLLEGATGEIVGAMEDGDLVSKDNGLSGDEIPGLLSANPESAVFDHQLVEVEGLAGVGSQMEPTGPMTTHYLGQEAVCRRKEYNDVAGIYYVYVGDEAFDDKEVTRSDYEKFVAAVQAKYQAEQEHLATIDPRLLGELRSKVTAFIDNF